MKKLLLSLGLLLFLSLSLTGCNDDNDAKAQGDFEPECPCKYAKTCDVLETFAPPQSIVPGFPEVPAINACIRTSDFIVLIGEGEQCRKIIVWDLSGVECIPFDEVDVPAAFPPCCQVLLSCENTNTAADFALSVLLTEDESDLCRAEITSIANEKCIQ